MGTDRAQRYSFELPVELDSTLGLTRDVSVTGLRFELREPRDVAPSPGDRLHLVVRFPDFSLGGDTRLHVDGHVVRIEPGSAGLSVAVAISGFRFEGAP
jgi:hypothetical protein